MEPGLGDAQGGMEKIKENLGPFFFFKPTSPFDLPYHVTSKCNFSRETIWKMLPAIEKWQEIMLNNHK
jgi:hypothetical protein